MTIFAKRIFAPPPPPLDGTHFIEQSLVSRKARDKQIDHAHSMYLSELLEHARPPDPELADLIERVFLEGQIDGREAELAYASLSKTVPIRAN